MTVGAVGGDHGDSGQSFGVEIVEDLRQQFPNATVTAVRHVPARRARYGQWPVWVPGWLRGALEDRGVGALFEHQ